MIAPLYDNRGSVRYFIGAQVDVTRLVEEGRGIDSFERLLAEERIKSENEASPDNNGSESNPPKKPIEVLGDLGEMLSWEETQEIQLRSRSASLCDDASIHSVAHTQNGRITMRPGGRRVLGTENDEDMEEKVSWGLSGSGLSGRLPGVYQNVRTQPIPSCRYLDFPSTVLSAPPLIPILVPPRPPCPFPPHHLRLSRPAHPGSTPIPLPLSHWWPRLHPRRHQRRLRRRSPRHRKSRLAPPRPALLIRGPARRRLLQWLRKRVCCLRRPSQRRP